MLKRHTIPKALCSSKIICLIFTTFLILSFFHFMHNIFNDSFIFLAKLTILTWLFYIYHTILFRKRAMRFLPHPLSFLIYLRFRSISIPWYRLGIGFPCFFATSQRCLYKRKRTDFLFFGTSGFSFFGSRLLILPSIIL